MRVVLVRELDFSGTRAEDEGRIIVPSEVTALEGSTVDDFELADEAIWEFEDFAPAVEDTCGLEAEELEGKLLDDVAKVVSPDEVDKTLVVADVD